MLLEKNSLSRNRRRTLSQSHLGRAIFPVAATNILLQLDSGVSCTVSYTKIALTDTVTLRKSSISVSLSRVISVDCTQVGSFSEIMLSTSSSFVDSQISLPFFSIISYCPSPYLLCLTLQFTNFTGTLLW